MTTQGTDERIPYDLTIRFSRKETIAGQSGLLRSRPQTKMEFSVAYSMEVVLSTDPMGMEDPETHSGMICKDFTPVLDYVLADMTGLGLNLKKPPIDPRRKVKVVFGRDFRGYEEKLASKVLKLCDTYRECLCFPKDQGPLEIHYE